MDTKKAETLLAKITNLQKTISFDSDNVSTIEKNLMLSYLQELYDIYLFLGDAPATKSTVRQAQKNNYSEKVEIADSVKQVPKKVVTNLPEHERKALEELNKYAPSEDSRRNPRVVHAGEYEPPAPVNHTPVKKAPKPVYKAPEPVPSTAYEEEKQQDEHLNKLFETKQANELSERLSQAPIKDLTKAMGINEKILNINELFDGDQQAFDIALNKLNTFKTYKEAQKFMSSELAPRYDWSDKSRVAKAQQFVNLVKRRYA